MRSFRQIARSHQDATRSTPRCVRSRGIDAAQQTEGGTATRATRDFPASRGAELGLTALSADSERPYP